MPSKRFFTGGKFNFPEDESVPKFKTHLFGDWEKTIRTLNRLAPEIKECSLRAQLKVGTIIKDRVKRHLRNQDLDWPPLGTKYARRKRAFGLDDRTLIAWGTYYHAINVWRVSNQHLVFIGVKSGIYTKNLRGRKSRLQVAQIAYIHEFASGKKNIRRPLWNPTIAELGGAKGIKTLFVKHFHATLRSHGIPFKMIKPF